MVHPNKSGIRKLRCYESIHENTFHLVHVIALMQECGTFLLLSRFPPKNLTFSSFKISVLKIFIPSGLLKTNEALFLILLVDCLVHSLYLKSRCKEYCHLHIQQSQYLLAFQTTYIYIYIYIYIY